LAADKFKWFLFACVSRHNHKQYQDSAPLTVTKKLISVFWWHIRAW